MSWHMTAVVRKTRFRRAVAARPGAAIGSTAWRSACKRDAPAIRAACSSSIGMSNKKPRIIQITSGRLNIRWARIVPTCVSSGSKFRNRTQIGDAHAG